MNSDRAIGIRRGTPTRQVARIVGVSRMSIHKWLTGSRTGGLDELTRRTRGDNRTTPRSPLIPDQQAQRIQHASTQGFRTLREAAAWCREALGVELSERPMRRVLEQLGFKLGVPMRGTDAPPRRDGATRPHRAQSRI
jgi:transposase